MNSTPPDQGVTTPPPIRTTHEADGYVLTCACGWLKWARSLNEAAEFRTGHAKSCKTCKAVAE